MSGFPCLRPLALVGLTTLALCASAAPARAQSSSLFAAQRRALARTTPPGPVFGSPAARGPNASKGNPTLEKFSFIAVAPPVPKVFKVHDIITIIVNESRRSRSRNSMEQEKDFKLEGAIEQWLRIHDGKLVPSRFRAGTPRLGLNFSSEFEGEGTSRIEERLTTRITAKVVDVKPNGNLVLAARKYIREDDEERTMTLTGECRSKTILPDNTILSTQVADLQIRVDTRGALRDATRRGWLPRALDWLRPF